MDKASSDSDLPKLILQSTTAIEFPPTCIAFRSPVLWTGLLFFFHSFLSSSLFFLLFVRIYGYRKKGREKEPPFSLPAIKRQEKEKDHETHKAWFRRGTLSRSKPVRRPCSSSHQIQGSPEPSPSKNLFQMTSPACHSASRLKECLCKSS